MNGEPEYKRLARLMRALLPNIGTYSAGLDWDNAARALLAHGVALDAAARVPNAHEHGPLSWVHGAWKCDVCGAWPVKVNA